MEAVQDVAVGLGDLAPELFLHIMTFLEPADLVRLEAVQHLWADILRHDNRTWRTAFRAHLGQGPSRSARAQGITPFYHLYSKNK